MKDFIKGKFVTSLVILATVILAGVAIFSALRLYKLRTESVAPTAPVSVPEASSGWSECRLGEPTHNVQACRNRAENYKGVSGPTDSSDLAWFSWAQSEPKPLSSDTTCGLAPSMCVEKPELVPCEDLSFIIEVTPTSTPSPTSTSTPTPTDIPPADCNDACSVDSDCSDTLVCHEEGGNSYCRNSECTGESNCSCPAPTSTPTNTPTNTPTPTTGGEISAISPTPGGTALPDAGVGIPTIISFGLGLIIIAFAILLAL